MNVLHVNGSTDGYESTFLRMDAIESMSPWEQADRPGVHLVLVRTISGHEFNEEFYSAEARDAYIAEWKEA
jgi:hypothetical protein